MKVPLGVEPASSSIIRIPSLSALTGLRVGDRVHASRAQSRLVPGVSCHSAHAASYELVNCAPRGMVIAGRGTDEWERKPLALP
jgi:hypothetical protein